MAKIDYGNWADNVRPAWAGDYLDREHLVPGGAMVDPAQFVAEDAVVVNVGAAGAPIGATTVPVDALSGPIPTGTTLYFNTNKFARLTAAAAAGATTLTVAPLPTALVDADVATYAGAGSKKKLIVSGTFLGRTFGERAAGTQFGPWATGDDEAYLIAHDVTDADAKPDCELYRHESIVKENFLPGFATLSTAALTAIRAAYQTTRGAN